MAWYPRSGCRCHATCCRTRLLHLAQIRYEARYDLEGRRLKNVKSLLACAGEQHLDMRQLRCEEDWSQTRLNSISKMSLTWTRLIGRELRCLSSEHNRIDGSSKESADESRQVHFLIKYGDFEYYAERHRKEAGIHVVSRN